MCVCVFHWTVAVVRDGRHPSALREGPCAVRPSGRQAVGVTGLAVPVDGRLL